MKIIDQIFCDDIRLEQRNKISLMGIYSDRLVFLNQKNDEENNRWPIIFKLGIFLRFKKEETEIHPNKFELQLMINNKSLPTFSGAFEARSTTNIINLAPTVHIPLELGTLGYSIKLLKDQSVLFEEVRKDALLIVSE